MARKSIRRRAGILIAAGLAAVVALALGLWIWTGRTGGTRIEQWIGRQLVEVVESHINPRLAWGRLDYQAPLTVVIDRLRIEDRGVSLVMAERVTLGLARVPRPGEPVLIERVEMESPALQFVNGSDGLVGWSHFLRAEVRRDPGAVPPGRRFSDILRLRHVSIRNAGVRYEPGDGGPAMSFSGVSARAETPPDADDPGWYKFDAAIAREGLFDIQLRGRFNVDTSEVELNPLQAVADLQEPQYRLFPPAVQDWLYTHSVRGGLELMVQGRAPLRRLPEAALTGEVKLHHAGLNWGRERIEIQALHAAAEVANGAASGRLEGDALDGAFQADLETALTGNSVVELDLEVRDIDLVALSRMLPAEALPDALQIQRGRTDATIAGRIALNAWRDSELNVRASGRDLLVQLFGLSPGAGSAAAGPPLQIASIEAGADIRPGGVSANWDAAAFDGGIRGSLTQTLKPTPGAPRGFAVELRFDGAQLALMRPYLPMEALAAAGLDPVSGRITGQAGFRAAAGQPLRDFSLAARLQDAAARFRGQPLRIGGSGLDLTVDDAGWEARGAVTLTEGEVIGYLKSTSDAIETDLQLRDCQPDAILALAGMHAPPFQARGPLNGTVAGRFPRNNWRTGAGRAQLEWRDAELRTGSAAFSIANLGINASAGNRAVDFDYRLRSRAGSGTGRGKLALEDAWPLELSWTVTDADLREVLVSAGRRSTELSGRLSTEGSLRLNLRQPRETLNGSARAAVESHDLLRVPFFSQLVSLVRGVLPRVPLGEAGRDRATFRGQLRPEFAEVEQFEMQCQLVVARGAGRVYYGGELDMRINAGPIEKLESLLGPIGDLLGKVTDRLVSYRVTGTFADPRFEVRPLGLGAR